MANTSAPDEDQQKGIGRPHARVPSSGTQSGNVGATNNTSIPVSSSTPTASITSLPRISSVAAASALNANSTSPQRTAASNSSLRSTTAASVTGQASPGSTRAVTSSSATSTALPARRDTFGSNQSTLADSRATASSYLSTAQSTPSTASSSSLFGFLGGARPTTDDSSVNHPYGSRAMSASNPTFNYGSSSATSVPNSAIASSTNTSETTNVYNSQRSLAPSTSNFQSRPAITSFLASGQGSHTWNTLPSRGATVGALQQMYQQQQHHSHNLVGSPARSQVTASGNSPPWIGTPQGQYSSTHSSNITGSTSGWTLADPTGSGALARSGRLCSGFEENQVVSFTWVISEANLLRDEVEKSPLPSEGGRSISAGAGKSEVWTTQPIFGDGKWKLELVRTSRPGAEIDPTTDEETHAPIHLEEGKAIPEANNTTTVLSVYLTNLVLDYSAADLEIPANIMIGIKPVQSRSRSSRSGPWIWQEFIHYIFRRENEYYECHQLPSLSDLLQDSDIERQDAFSLTIQISTGPRASAKSSEQGLGRISDTNQASPFIVQDNQLVHHSLINGLERLLDCRGTGDVVLIVRERGVVKRQRRSSGDTASQDEVWTRPVGTPMFDWGQSQEDVQVVVRDRLLWAHSSILGARSEFFRDMLQSNFAEGQEQEVDIGESASIQIQGRKVRTLRINDADFTTIYWLLRYLYLEEVEFLSNEDVRCAALDDDWMATGQTSAEEGLRMAVWHWTPLSQVEAAFEGSQGQSLDAPLSHGRDVSRHRQTSISGPTSPNTLSSPTRSKSTIIPHEIYGSHQRRVASDRESRLSARPSMQEPPSPDTQNSPTTKKEENLHQSPIFVDPHLHPCEKPPPASALAIYRLAHRYHQEGLVHLAKVQLIGSLTPHTAFPTLLATHLYSDLYEHVKVYVLDKWDLVSQTSEFERCCDEVSAGEWGVEAGRALRLFMRSLLSPNRAR